jgi:HD-like signal output (HDOD) protein
MTSALVDLAPADTSPMAWPSALAARPIDDGEIDQLARGLHGGSSFAPGAPQLLKALLDPALDLPTLASRVSAEPGLAIQVLRVANSPYYGHAGAVASVSRAAQVLGVRALRGIAAAACFGSIGIPPQGRQGLDMAAFRRHGLATACAGQSLAEQALPGLVDEAFMAGLLHDMGMLVQWWLRPQAMAWLTESVPAAQRSATEVALLGASHAHCGQRLLMAWHLPPALVAAIGPQRAGSPPGNEPARGDQPFALAALLGLADRLAVDTGHTLDGDEPAVELPTDAALAASCRHAAQALPNALQRLGV